MHTSPLDHYARRAAIRARRLRAIDAHIEATRDPQRIAALVKEWLREVGRV